MSNIITISKTPSGYNASYAGDMAEEIFLLFGTRTLPTSFTAGASMGMVKAEIERLNPGYTIKEA